MPRGKGYPKVKTPKHNSNKATEKVKKVSKETKKDKKK